MHELQQPPPVSHAEPHVGLHEVPYLGHQPPTRRHLPRAPEWTAHAKQGGPFLFSLGECPVGHHWVDDVNVYLSAVVHFEGGGLAVCNLLLSSRGR